jgi:3-phenylpropionate/trans-cinnamate dioxygenase ferredoxin subunit
MRVAVAEFDQLEEDVPLGVKADGHDILLVRSEGSLFAIQDLCPHAQQSLVTGKVSRGRITCRHHGVQIDLATGKVLWSMGFLNLQPVKTYPVTQEDGTVWIEV